jgi:hypothetical protein
MSDRLASRPKLERLRPNDLSLDGQRLARCVKGDPERRARREHLGEEEQKAVTTDIAGSPLEGRSSPAVVMTRDAEV